MKKSHPWFITVNEASKCWQMFHFAEIVKKNLQKIDEIKKKKLKNKFKKLNKFKK